MSQKGSEKRVLSVGEVAAMAGVSVDTVRAWDRQGRLPARRSPGGQRRFPLEDVESFLQQGEGPRGGSGGGHTRRELPEAGVRFPNRVESELPQGGRGAIALGASGGVRHDQSSPSDNSTAGQASYAAYAEQVRRETEARIDVLRLNSLKAYGRGCAIGVPAEWMAYVVRDLETYVTPLQFPPGLGGWDSHAFVEARVKRLLQPYWDEIAKREEAESRRMKLVNLLECGRRYLRSETFLWPKEEAEEAEDEVERELGCRVKWDWSERSVRNLVDDILEGEGNGDTADESGSDDGDPDEGWESDEEED